MRGLFESVPAATRRNMVSDAKKMAEHECGVELSDREAEYVVRGVLGRARMPGALYRVSSRRLADLVAEARAAHGEV